MYTDEKGTGDRGQVIVQGEAVRPLGPPLDAIHFMKYSWIDFFDNITKSCYHLFIPYYTLML